MQPEPQPEKKADERRALLMAAALLLFFAFLGVMVLAASLPLFDDFVFRVVVAQTVGASVIIGALVAVCGVVGGLIACVLAIRTSPNEGQAP